MSAQKAKAGIFDGPTNITFNYCVNIQNVTTDYADGGKLYIEMFY